VFYVREVDTAGSRLVDVMIYQLTDGAFPRMITARGGTFSDREWLLEDVITREIGPDGFVEREVRAESLAFPMEESTEAFFGNQRTTDEMNRAELAEHIRLFQRSGIDVRPFLVDYHMKLALPFASLVLSLLAAPLSLWGGRHGWVFGLGASIGLAFLYYTLMALFRSLGTNGVLPPLVAVWAGNVLFGVVGLRLLLRADAAGRPWRSGMPQGWRRRGVERSKAAKRTTNDERRTWPVAACCIAVPLACRSARGGDGFRRRGPRRRARQRDGPGVQPVGRPPLVFGRRRRHRALRRGRHHRGFHDVRRRGPLRRFRGQRGVRGRRAGAGGAAAGIRFRQRRSRLRRAGRGALQRRRGRPHVRARGAG